jgi:hypothetical protein
MNFKEIGSQGFTIGRGSVCTIHFCSSNERFYDLRVENAGVDFKTQWLVSRVAQMSVNWSVKYTLKYVRHFLITN